MGMTIDETLKIIKDGRIIATIIKGNNEDDTKFNQENIEALNTIVYTMRKYQKIEKIIEDWERDKGWVLEISELYWLDRVKEVIENE